MSGRRLACLGLTFFAWCSALTVGLCGAIAWSGTRVAIMAAEPRMRSHGLVYDGRGGAALALGEAALVLLALRGVRDSRPWPRRLGAAGLFAWALLWAVNALRWNAAAAEPMTFSIGAGLLASLVCAALVLRGAASRA